MGIGHWGSKEYVEMKKASVLKDVPLSASDNTIQLNDNLDLHNRISDLEYQLSIKRTDIQEVPVEFIKYVDRIVEVPVEKIIEKRIEIITEFPVVKEKIVKEFIDVVREVELIREVEVVKEIKFIPLWAYGAFLVQTLAMIILLLK